MDTFFARHGRNWNIDDATRAELFDNSLIAIHYEAIASLDPDDYSIGRPQIKLFRSLAQNGGLVLATYFPRSGCKVGRISPLSEVEFKKVDGSDGQSRILKILRLQDVREFTAPRAQRVLVLQPRLQAFSRWPSIGDRVARLYANQPLVQSLDDLLPFEHEVLCTEYLRLGYDSRLPILKYLLARPGGTQQDVDIVGFAQDGKLIYCQVTFQALKAAHPKVEALKQYAGQAAHVIMFSKGDFRQADGITFYPIFSALDKILGRDAALKAAMGFPS